MHILERAFHLERILSRRPSGYVALQINYALSQFVWGMVNIFGVLFVFQLGTTLLEGLSLVAGYYIFQRIVTGLVNPSVGRITSKIGYRWMMLAGLSFLAARLLLFRAAEIGMLWPLIPAGILGGMAIPSYYMSFHALFLDDNDDARVGEQIGVLVMLGKVATVLSPFFAGLLVSAYGFAAMFSVAVGILLISSVPLFLMKRHKRHQGTFSTKRVWKFIRTRTKVSWSMYAWSLTMGIQVFFWPIYLLLVLKDYTFLGAVGSGVMLVNSVAVYKSGRLYDRAAHKNVFLASSAGTAASWVARFMSATPIAAIVSDAVNRIFSPPWWMKIRRLELLAGEKVDSLVFGAAHEYLITFGYVSAILVSFLVLVLTGVEWLWLAILAVAFTLVATWVVRDE